VQDFSLTDGILLTGTLIVYSSLLHLLTSYRPLLYIMSNVYFKIASGSDFESDLGI